MYVSSRLTVGLRVMAEREKRLVLGLPVSRASCTGLGEPSSSSEASATQHWPRKAAPLRLW